MVSDVFLQHGLVTMHVSCDLPVSDLSAIQLEFRDRHNNTQGLQVDPFLVLEVLAKMIVPAPSDNFPGTFHRQWWTIVHNDGANLARLGDAGTPLRALASSEEWRQ